VVKLVAIAANHRCLGSSGKPSATVDHVVARADLQLQEPGLAERPDVVDELAAVASATPPRPATRPKGDDFDARDEEPLMRGSMPAFVRFVSASLLNDPAGAPGAVETPCPCGCVKNDNCVIPRR